jgi:methylated-DNA-[protein]-cysteine S-methyltransferase
MEALRYTLLESPLGPVLVAGTGEGLRRINFQHGDAPLPIPPEWEQDDAALAEAAAQLRAYFAGRLRVFDLPLRPEGTPFQKRVWQALRGIPYGQTRTYGQLAHSLGQPTAARAVGAANGKNPLPIVVPCHRVIGGTGALTGFHGGLRLKEFLLALERRHGSPAPAQTELGLAHDA